jgi:uncharacterized membrane protein
MTSFRSWAWPTSLRLLVILLLSLRYAPDLLYLINNISGFFIGRCLNTTVKFHSIYSYLNYSLLTVLTCSGISFHMNIGVSTCLNIDIAVSAQRYDILLNFLNLLHRQLIWCSYSLEILLWIATCLVAMILFYMWLYRCEIGSSLGVKNVWLGVWAIVRLYLAWEVMRMGVEWSTISW